MSLLQALINSGEAEDMADAIAIRDKLAASMYKGDNPEELLLELGLEPDYVFDLL